MSERDRSIIDYIVACINDFAERHKMDVTSGFDYLNQLGGLDFLERNYDIEHTYPIDDTIEDMTAVCCRNGGTIR